MLTGAALVGVDLLPNGSGGWVVVEINGAVDFTASMRSHPGHDPFADAASRLAEAARSATPGRACAGGSWLLSAARVGNRSAA